MSFNSLKCLGINFGEDVDLLINDFKTQMEDYEARKYRKNIWIYHKANVKQIRQVMKKNVVVGYLNPGRKYESYFLWNNHLIDRKTPYTCNCCNKPFIGKRKKRQVFSCSYCPKIYCCDCFSILNEQNLFKYKSKKKFCCSGSKQCIREHNCYKYNNEYLYNRQKKFINDVNVIFPCSVVNKFANRVINNMADNFVSVDRKSYIENSVFFEKYDELIKFNKNKLKENFYRIIDLDFFKVYKKLYTINTQKKMDKYLKIYNEFIYNTYEDILGGHILTLPKKFLIRNQHRY